MYSIKLVNYSFDDTYSNIRLFDDKVSRETFFDDLQGQTQNVDNFNAGNLLKTQVVFDANVSIPLTKLLNFNYCIVKLLDENGGISSDNESLYFHIKRCRQGSDFRIIIDLEIDPFMTYWYDIEFSDCLITRAHLDRFIKNSNGTYSFDGRAISNLFEREDIKDISKRLIAREKLQLYSEINSQIATWLNNNVVCWVYITLSAGNYKVGNPILYDEIVEKELLKTEYVEEKLGYDYFNAANPSSISSGHVTLCYPIYKTDVPKIQFALRFPTGETKNIILSSSGLLRFLKQNGGYSNVYSIKLSVKPPIDLYDKLLSFDLSNQNILKFNVVYQQSLTGDGDIKIKNNDDSNSPNKIILSPDGNLGAQAHDSLIYIEQEEYKEIIFKISESFAQKLPKITFSKNEIIGANRNKIFNPKLNNADYKSLSLCFNGSTFDYDLQKINSNNLKFSYKEMISADVTKFKLVFKSENNEDIFNDAHTNGFNGLIGTNDLSLPISNDLFDAFLANNKNAYISFQNQQNYNLQSSAIKMASTAASGMMRSAINPLNAPLAAGEVVEEGAQSILKYNYEQAQFNLSIDNMRSAPDKLVNANGSAIFSNAVSEFGLYIELYEGLNCELDIANDYAFENGFYYNQYGNIKDFCCTRKYFNYIEAIPDNIIGNLSNELKQYIKSVLSRGVRFWHVDEISYTLENYEKLLEEA